MKRSMTLTFLILAVLLVTSVSCRGGDREPAPTGTEVGAAGPTATRPAPTQPATATSPQITLTKISPTAEPTRAPVAPEIAPEIAGKLWEWQEFQDPAGLSEVEVSDPALYTLTLEPDGRFDFQADCNLGNGRYTADGSRLRLDVEAVTEVDCGPQSLDREYIQYLSQVATFISEPPAGLILNLAMDGGNMIFASGSAAEAAPEGPLTLTASGVTIEPQGFGRSLEKELVPARPYDSSQPPGPVGYPEHVAVTLDGRVIAWVMPVSEYEQQWQEAGDMTISNSVGELQALIKGPSSASANARPPLPILPPQNASNDLAVQYEKLDFKSGSGIRFVGRTVQAPLPVANEQLNYYFQGLTGDGRYLVSLIYPVAAAGTPSTVEQVPEETRQRAAGDYDGYLQEAAQQYDELAGDDFTPALSQLDALAASITVEPEPGREMVDELAGRVWQWLSITDPAAGTTAIENPSKYTVAFLPDGQIMIQADCKSAGGLYALQESRISILAALPNQANCGPESRADQFIRSLGAAAILFFDGDDLFLDLMMDSGTMRLSEPASGGPIPSSEGALVDEPQVEVIELDLQGLAPALSWQLVPGTPYGDCCPPGPTGMPAHLVASFDGLGQASLTLIPLPAYQSLWQSAGNDLVSRQVDRLNELIGQARGRQEAPQGDMPLLPRPAKTAIDWLQFNDLEFESGQGVRYVARTSPDPLPYTNDQLDFYYQGLTADGLYYVSLIFPVSTESLADSFADVSPEATSELEEDPQGYLQRAKAQLDDLSPADWRPDLARLDAMVSSLTLKP